MTRKVVRLSLFLLIAAGLLGLGCSLRTERPPESNSIRIRLEERVSHLAEVLPFSAFFKLADPIRIMTPTTT